MMKKIRYLNAYPIDSGLQTNKISTVNFFSPRVRAAVLLFLFLAASGIRLYHLFAPPLDFASNRQYHSLIIARNYYFQLLPSIPDWRKRVARLNFQIAARAEPHILEYLVSRIYYLAGGEHLWIPRLLSVTFWLVGGAALYLIAARLFSQDAALFAAAFYLFAPYGIRASRSFQPNSLAMMLLLFSILSILKYIEYPRFPRLLLAAIVTVMASFVRPFVLFPIAGIFLVLLLSRRKRFKSLPAYHSLLFFIITLFPAGIYYGYILFFTADLAAYNRQEFLPSLLLKPIFWQGWLNQIKKVIGYSGLLAALFGLGVVSFLKGPAKRLLFAFSISYVLFGCLFTYVIHTHHYYNLWLIPITALLIGAVSALGLNRLRSVSKRNRWRIVVLGGLSLWVFWSAWNVKNKLVVKGGDRLIKVAREIGELVQHSTKTVYLSQHYGKLLKYYGEISGLNWPRHFDFHAYQLSGRSVLGVEERFKIKYAINTPEYFIITCKEELSRQKELKEFLFNQFPVLVENRYYVIFDLRNQIQE